MKVEIDLPIFASPTKAWGNARREIEISWVPDEGDWLELPFADHLTALGLPSPMLVWSAVPQADGIPTILMDGAVFAGRQEAARVAGILERDFGFEIEEYGP
jgi:hypothetical protein